MHGHFGNVLQNITGTYARDAALARLSRADAANRKSRADLAAIRRDLDRREVAVKKREDAIAAREAKDLAQRKADRIRAEQEAMARRVADYMARLPDPDRCDDPQPGSVETTHPPVDTSYLGDTSDGPTGSLPRDIDLTEDPSPEPAHPAQPPKSTQTTRLPASVSLW
jgi:hypothetical protein